MQQLMQYIRIAKPLDYFENLAIKGKCEYTFDFTAISASKQILCKKLLDFKLE